MRLNLLSFNSAEFGGGIIGSVVIRETVAISGQAMVDVWSERLCPDASASAADLKDAPDVCRGALSVGEQKSASAMLSGKLIDRDLGARLGLGINVEVRVSRWFNIYVAADIAPGQFERAGYSGWFHAPLVFDRDPGMTGRAGISLLF